MAVLASITNQQDYLSPAEINVPASGPVQLFISGSIGRGRVVLLLKGADGVFHAYPELIFRELTAGQLNLLVNDKLKVQVIDCTAVNVEVRQ